MLDCGIKANCPHLKPVPLGECPPWSSFQGILARIYVSFRENHGKLRGRQARLGIEPGTSRLAVLTAELLCHCWDTKLYNKFRIKGSALPTLG